MVESPINSTRPSLLQNVKLEFLPTASYSPQGGGQSLSTPPQPSPTPCIPLHPSSNMSAYEFVKDYHYVMSHDLLDMNGGNHLSIPNNIWALWMWTEHIQQTMEDHDRQIHTLSTQLNEILQAFTDLQRSHQLLQDMVRLNGQEVDKEIASLCFQLSFLQDKHALTPNLSIFAMADPNQPPSISTSPTPHVATIPNLITSRPNLKPAKPDMWDSTDYDTKPFQNRVLNYLGLLSGMAFSKQVVFVLSLMTHASHSPGQTHIKTGSWTAPPIYPSLLWSCSRTLSESLATQMLLSAPSTGSIPCSRDGGQSHNSITTGWQK